MKKITILIVAIAFSVIVKAQSVTITDVDFQFISFTIGSTTHTAFKKTVKTYSDEPNVRVQFLNSDRVFKTIYIDFHRVVSPVGISRQSAYYLESVIRSIVINYADDSGGGGTSIIDSAWTLYGNTGTTAGTNFLGTTDSVALSIKTNSNEWMRLQTKGQLKLMSGYDNGANYDSTGSGGDFNFMTNNIFVGDTCGLLVPVTGSGAHDSLTSHNNVAIGRHAMRYAEKAFANTAIGVGALMHNKGEWGNAGHNPGTPFGSGYENVAIGAYCMINNTTGYENTAVGTGALTDNTTGTTNTAIGQFSLGNNTIGYENNALGRNALAFNTTGVQNIAIGNDAGFNHNGTHLIAIGYQASQDATAANYSVAIGGYALNNITSGVQNIALGFAAGAGTSSTASNSIYIGAYAGLNLNMSNMLIVDNYYNGGNGRASAEQDTTLALLYGQIGMSTTAAQRLRVNGHLYVAESLIIPNLTTIGGATDSTLSRNPVTKAIELRPVTAVASGTYTPTLFNVTNIAASTAYSCQWLRVDSTVTVSGKVDIDVTIGVASELGMSLPIASNLTAEENCGGTASSAAAASLVSAIRGDATNDRAAFVFTAVSLTNDSYFFEFTYRIK